ncbi:hypothetical protein HDU82_005309 [Entophlyctis luteolus]|nr:hypothetical protein HDU82_005309 [Entophlyctis luteolus]
MIGNPSVVQNSMTLYAPIVVSSLLFCAIPTFMRFNYLLLKDYGWRQFRSTGGDISLRRKILIVDMFLVFLKFLSFFLLSFTIIDLVLTAASSEELTLTLAFGSILAVLIPVSGLYAVRLESVPLFVVYELGGLLMFGYIVYRIYSALKPNESLASMGGVEAPLILFAVAGLLLDCLALWYGQLCFRSFGEGLQKIIEAVRNGDDSFLHGESKGSNLDD